MIRHSHRFFPALAFAAIGLSAFAAPPSSVNALWNDSNGFGIWIYPGTGGCPEMQTRLHKVLVVGPKFKAGESAQSLRLGDLKLCAQFDGGENQVVICKEGFLQLQYLAASKEYVGNYNVVLTDGTNLQGPLRARHCPKE